MVTFLRNAVALIVFSLISLAFTQGGGEQEIGGSTPPESVTDANFMLQEQMRHELMMMQLRGSRELGRGLGQIVIE